MELVLIFFVAISNSFFVIIFCFVLFLLYTISHLIKFKHEIVETECSLILVNKIIEVSWEWSSNIRFSRILFQLAHFS